MTNGTLASLLRQLGTSHSGLTAQEAHRRMAEYGPNDPTARRHRGVLLQFLTFFVNPLAAILLIASLVSALAGEVVNAAIIATIVILSVVLNFLQSFRSQRAADRLRDQVAPTATAMRDGAWVEVPRREVVPGDIIRLSAGDLVPADARLLQAHDLHVQQAALTGESLPADKEVSETEAASTSPAEARGSVFLGTSVVSGTATAVVHATGRRTVFGDIAVRLTARPPESEFERGSRNFGLLIMRTVIFLVLFVFLFSVALHRPALESLLFAIALAVGLTPEFLPMITTVTLGQGAVHMARHKVIVKNLEAIQNFGSIDILCSDKTGTLTSGRMTYDRNLGPFGQPSDKVFLYAYLNSVFETGIKSPLDAAILDHSRPDTSGYAKLDEIPFDFERRRLSVVVQNGQDRELVTKGAPEGVLAACSSYEVDGRQAELSTEARGQCEATYQGLSAQGYRTLAIAYRPVPDQAAYKAEDEKDLILLGFATFADPPLPEVPEVLRALREDGVQVKILSGDNELVARHVCSQVGLDVSRIVLGDELDQMSDTALGQVAEQTAVFARVSPAQKNRILLALKRRNHVVGFLGDGINDAPSLHAADVGISVSGAVDVAKDAAEVILLEPSLRALHEGIVEGRKAFGNVIKYLVMGTSSNFGNMFSMAGAVIFLPFLPMLPTQILINNLLYDLSQVTIPTDRVDPSFVLKPRHWNISFIRNFMLLIGPISSVYDYLTFFVLLSVFHASEPLFHTGWFVESLATQTLVLLVIRTTGNPFRNRPSLPLAITVLAVALVGLGLPLSPLARILGFTPLPLAFFAFLAAATVTYLALVELAKRPLMRRLTAA
jgi:Mg2+-importing ATPase